jgi:hypothetical protein
MSDTQSTLRRPRPHIHLKDDVLLPRCDFAAEIGITDRTAQRLNLPTTYVGGMAHVPRAASLEIIAAGIRRRNQPPPAPTRRRNTKRARGS